MTSANTDLTALVNTAWMLRKIHFPASIQFNYPTGTKVLSVTGSHCSLNCAHCGGHYLKNMTPLQHISADCQAGNLHDCTSCLISGGCDSHGKVPLASNWELLKKLKATKRMNLHVGLVSEEEAKKLPEVCDVVSFDMVGDDETIREVYGLDKSASDYRKSYNILRKYVKVLPHICIGLRGGKISGEYRVLEMLAEDGADGLVFIVFSPTKNTRYAAKEPPPLEEVVKVFATARRMFPHIPIHLGCMRPKGRYREKLDVLAVRCGVNKIVVPTKKAVETAKNLGLKISYGEECCVL
ncbi:MAG: radical SAM protein [Thermoanaerobacteraceae bacterium]|nr:radical SAM protein [Thermoanaerobacteraceae bacterium]